MNLTFLSCTDKQNFMAIGLTQVLTAKLVDALKLQFENFYEFSAETKDLINDTFKKSLMEIYNIPFEKRVPILLKIDQEAFEGKTKIICDLISESKPLKITFYLEIKDFSRLSISDKTCILGNFSTYIINYGDKYGWAFGTEQLHLEPEEEKVHYAKFNVKEGKYDLEKLK